MSTIPAGRHQYILSLINKNGTVNVADLAGELEVSELTIRRDLDQMAKDGLVERTHGGAAARRNLPVEPDYLQKASEFPDEKEAIGKLVATLIEEGDTLYVNSGSTTFEAIRAIVALGKKVTIVTNNIDAIWLCKEQEQIRLILAGGVYRPRSHSVSGSLSSYIVSEVYANKAIIGVDGFSLTAGLSTPVLEEAETTRAMIEHTVGKVIVVACGNKIGVVSNFKTVSLDRVDVLVTDQNGGHIIEQMETPEGLQVLIAEEKI
ncbi:DeoR/GlpR family DNA-binding transcription regulator [uncultured Sphaerochaeta sp.]|uniref:DeoR/GlpR family DNA-binding transcription regulator n=1 Tax=uncultured Sphaerochaeta sp. TaxID=886478 RepID=UPI002A0A469E|nr:DeoR/GlpR family DNA-binding transcription regulator [uncultured Sphaerochaeta sp.]